MRDFDSIEFSVNAAVVCFALSIIAAIGYCGGESEQSKTRRAQESKLERILTLPNGCILWRVRKSPNDNACTCRNDWTSCGISK